MNEQEREKGKKKKSLNWAILWVIVGALYALNPVDLPGPIDDLMVAALAVYKTYKNVS